jgi:hypothetical protein
LLRATCPHYSASDVQNEATYLGNDGEFNRLEGVLQMNAELLRRPLLLFQKLTNIDQRLRNKAGMLVPSPPLRHLPVTEISAVPPDLEVECNDRLPSRNPPARNTATSLPEMPNSHDAGAHLAGAYGIRTSHVRMLHMRPGRKNRYSVRSNEVRRCWLARWRIAAADVRSWRLPTLPQSPDRKHSIAPFHWLRHSLSPAIIVVARY